MNPAATHANLRVRRRTLTHGLTPYGLTITTGIGALTDASAPIPSSLRELGRLLRVVDVEQRHFEIAQVFWEILRRQIVLTENRRVPFERRFTHDVFDGPIDLRDGAKLPAELFRLKNGSHTDRQQYSAIQRAFYALTQLHIDIRSAVEPSHVSNDGVVIEPVVVNDSGEIPIQFAGAGAQEALVLSALLPGGDGRLLVLDEPAVNIEPTTQRRLSSLLRNGGQCLIITHSPDLVVIDTPADLGNIVRLAPSDSGPQPMRPKTVDVAMWTRWLNLLEPSHVRALLFASKVILCEGQTEVGALRQWWQDTNALGLPSPEAANIPIISVGSDTAFGAFIEYLDTFGVPWAAIADGPALRRNSHLARQLKNLGRLPKTPEPAAEDFARWRDYWEASGVFTMANSFGDDQSKSGEFEAYLNRTDSALLNAVRDEVGKSKPQMGARFAAQHPRPSEVAQLYRKIMARWDSRL